MTSTTLQNHIGPAQRLTDRFIIGLIHRFNSAVKRAVGDDRPAFHDKAKIFPRLAVLDENVDIIRAEMEQLLPDKDQIPRYHEISPSEQYISGTVNPDRAWRVFTLIYPAGKLAANCERCPQTAALIGQVPGVFNAFFSILDPNKSIPAHEGVFYGYLRYHLALRVPAENPPSIRVRDQVYTWIDGDSVVFDDSLEHEVYNKSSGERVVLIVDMFRPLPFRLHMMNWLLLRVLTPMLSEARSVLDNIKKR